MGSVFVHVLCLLFGTTVVVGGRMCKVAVIPSVASAHFMELAGFLGSGRHPSWGSSDANTNGLIHYGQRCDPIVAIRACLTVDANVARDDTRIQFAFPRGGAGNGRVTRREACSYLSSLARSRVPLLA